MGERTFKTRSSVHVARVGSILAPIWTVIVIAALVRGEVLTSLLGLGQLVAMGFLLFAARDSAALTLGEESVRLKLPVRTAEFAYADVSRVHSEIMGTSEMTVRTSHGSKTYQFRLRAEEIAELRALLRERAPHVKLTGLPNATIAASERT